MEWRPGVGVHLPFDGVQHVHSNVDKDGPFAHIAEGLESIHYGDPGHAAHIVQSIMADSHSTAEEGNDSTQT